MKNEKLLSILEGYKAKSGDEQNFMDKHTENMSIMDGPGYAEIRKATDAVSYINRNPVKGYNPGQDAEVYEEYADVINQAVEDFLEEASDEERETLEELFSTEEGYDEFVSMIFEKDEDDDDEDDDDDDEDDDDDVDDDEEDGEIETNPKVKKESKKKAKSGY